MIVNPARIAELASHAFAAAMAWRRVRLGRVDFTPALRPLWLFLALTLAADALRWLGQHFVLRRATRPFTGLQRAVFHADQVGVIGWHAGLLAIVVLAFTGRERVAAKLAPIASFAVGIAVSLAIAYPSVRAEKLGVAYMIVEVATVLACIAFVAHAWLLRRWFGVAPRAVSVLVVGEVATMFGPFLSEPFRHWSTANAISTVTYTILAWELRRSATVLAT